MNSGIINVLKPAGMTSNAVLTHIKKTLHPNKIGHLGTLDPSGTGVLPVCINKATKLFDLYLKKDKHYRAIFVFGKTTDTLDSDGVIVDQNNCVVSLEDINSVLQSFVGKQSQMPPKYSAKKINGQIAYNLARENVEFELSPKEIEIYSIKVVCELSKNKFLFDIKCSSGTYVRSIVRDIATKLNTFGYMGAIIRLRSGNFDIANAIKLCDVTENSIEPLKNVLKDRQKIFISSDFYDKIVNGCKVHINHNDITDCVVFCNNELIGIGDVQNSVLKIKTNLREKYD
jgi:tRNA pseudouridine55 synthase